jgi:translation initiation factor IF-2
MIAKPQQQHETRPPVIAVMGHIDHGKSTLLDYIRKTNIVETEAGGITQHISSYEVEHQTKDGGVKRITFLDTPGHAAFETMRSRGAIVADIAILVVSAEDGVKPQTLEARRAILEAKVPYVVAITKIDKPNADVARTKNSLVENEIYVEGYGGDVPVVPLSSKSGEGIPELLDILLLVAEMQDLSGDPSLPGTGIVIESSLDRKKGNSATLIVKEGSIHQGTFVVAGNTMAPVRIMEDFRGKQIKEARFGMPVRIIGFTDVPEVGTTFFAVPTKKEAEKLLSETAIKKSDRASAEAHPEGTILMPIIVKGDVRGSVEAVIGEMMKLQSEKVKVDVIHHGVGAISENDVKMASASPKTIIIGFNVSVESGARDIATRFGVTIETFDIIYKLSERVEAIIVERTPRVETEIVRGKLKVLKTFNTDGKRQVLGGKVLEGELSVNDNVRITRRDVEIGRGKITNIQVSKLDAQVVKEGGECGLQLQMRTASQEVAGGDVIESIIVEIK